MKRTVLSIEPSALFLDSPAAFGYSISANMCGRNIKDMKVSDYIVAYLITNGIRDVFGYPGGMVTHLMDSLGRRKDEIATHITYHEQGAAFAACGYAQASGKVGVAFATSGPGATNLLTGICNAYFDSIPAVFITGQVNTNEAKGELSVRQKGFQETDIVSMASGVTKAAIYIRDAGMVEEALERAFSLAMSGRKGPVLLDVPMNVFRSEMELLDAGQKEAQALNEENGAADLDQKERDGEECRSHGNREFIQCLKEAFSLAKRPCLLLGNGIRTAGQIEQIRSMILNCRIPVVSSMLAVDLIPEDIGLQGTYYGFIGAYGNRSANFVVAKCDLLICLGSRLDVRQVGGVRERFAPDAKIIRVDIDAGELDVRIREDEQQFLLSLELAIPLLQKSLPQKDSYADWLMVCRTIKEKVKYVDEKEPNRVINAISRLTGDDCSIAADVGQNMVWVAQSFHMKHGQRLYMSGGHGAMGYALPAAIGIYYATRRPVVCFSGDGGFQMNIQELQFVSANRLPITMIVLNNQSLGMIRHFQEMYFENNYYYTVSDNGYTVPDFCAIAKAYGIRAERITGLEEVKGMQFEEREPKLYEVVFDDRTVVSPKLEFGKPNQDQEPLLDRALYEYLMKL